MISDQLKIRTTLADEPDLCVAHGLSANSSTMRINTNLSTWFSGSRSDLLEDE